MYVAEIWRYPVKSMAGQQLQSARLTGLGIDGDRIIQVQNAQGRVVTSRTYPELLGFHAILDELGQPVVDGKPWSDPGILSSTRRIVGPGAQLVRDESPERFDVLPLLVATDGAIAAFGRDRRRLRPNLVIGGVNGLGERTWPGRRLGVPARSRAAALHRRIAASFGEILRRDSGLYRAIREAFQMIDASITDSTFLTVFRESGCYLVDLCPEPVDHLAATARRDACRLAERNLSRVIDRFQPALIATLLRSVKSNVLASIAIAHWKGSVLHLAYPGRWKHLRKALARELTRTVRPLVLGRTATAVDLSPPAQRTVL